MSVCVWGGGSRRVTLHGESCPVGAVAPAHIDLDEECERARVCVFMLLSRFGV